LLHNHVLHRGFLALGRLAAALLVAGCILTLAACGQPSGQINVVQSTDLAQTTQIEIAEMVTEPQTDYKHRLTITDTSSIHEVVMALDRDLPLGPRARCQGQFRLRFHLATNQVQEFEYYCEGGVSFLRGGQAFWQGQQVEPPAEFDQLIQRLLAAQPGGG